MCAKMVRCQKNDACIYLKGPQGCVKSTFPEFLRDYVMGSDYSLEAGSDPIKGRFNAELLKKVFVILEELENFGAGEWMGISSKLKRWITSNVMTIEGKGVDAIQVENIITFWLLSNNDAIQDDDGRRYFILPISTELMRDTKYFEDLRKQCFNKEVGEAYYNYLMEIDLTNFYSQNYPTTETKLDAIAKKLDNVYKFLKEKYILKNRGIKKTKVQDLYKQYEQYCVNMQYKIKHKIDFCRLLEEVGLVRRKDDTIYFYDISYEQLKNISDKFHWVHELDEAEKE
jgi:phage/plasmid-associated DNA primase